MGFRLKIIAIELLVVTYCAAISFAQGTDSPQVLIAPSSAIGGSSSSDFFSRQLHNDAVPSVFRMVLVAPQRGFEADPDQMSRRIADALRALADKNTFIAPSHLGHPGSENIAFVYDKAVDAMVFKATSDQVSAEKVLDYFAERLKIPKNEIKRYADANGLYGILKLIPSVDDPRAVGLANAFRKDATDREGRATLEYWATPGPLAFMTLAFMYVNPEKYRAQALMLGDALLAMQREDGGIVDGDRDPKNVNTEPHMDTFAAFLRLYDLTKDARWSVAAEKCWQWFKKNVYVAEHGVVQQGFKDGRMSEIFATDVYSWTMAGPAGDRLSFEELDRLTARMLDQALTQVTLELPDGQERTVILVDFADVRDMRIIADRGGFHPMGSIEWIGGVILALQKNAVRAWKEGDSVHRDKARYYKALAELFMTEAIKSYYAVDGLSGLITFYATGQWLATGHGWHTPYFYVKDPNGKPVIKGGSSIGAWPVLPMKRVDPFDPNNKYGVIYDQIPQDDEMKSLAKKYVDGIVHDKSFAEHVPTEMVAGVGDSPELWRYNQQMFQAFNNGNYYEAILWAKKVVGDPTWVKQARDQQKRKEREVGGLIDYAWGTPLKDARDQALSIARYPLLNEVGTAMWGLAVSNYYLGNKIEAKAWIRAIIESVAYHQILAPDGPGFWNALVSWEVNPGGSALDAQMGDLYREVLLEMGRLSAMPEVFPVK